MANRKQNKAQEYSPLPITTYTMIVICIFSSMLTRDSVWIGFKAALLLTVVFLAIYLVFPKPRVNYLRWVLHVVLMMIMVWLGVWILHELLSRWLWKPLTLALPVFITLVSVYWLPSLFPSKKQKPFLSFFLFALIMALLFGWIEYNSDL